MVGNLSGLNYRTLVYPESWILWSATPLSDETAASQSTTRTARRRTSGAVVLRIEVADPDPGRFVLGVDELPTADVDASVRQAAAIGVLEEDEVARLQFIPSDTTPISY